MEHRRVVITGVGVICPIGRNTPEFWQNCLRGESNVTAIPEHWNQYSSFKSRFWAPLPEIRYDELGLTKAQILQLDPVALNILSATVEALVNAGFTVYKNSDGKGHQVADINPEEFGVYMGTGVGGIHSLLENHNFPVLSNVKAELKEILRTNTPLEGRERISDVVNLMVHPRRINPFIVSMLMPNAVSANVGLCFGFKGPNTTYSVACASSTVAIGRAFKAIQSGVVSTILAGGSEYLNDHCGYIFRGFDVAGTLTTGEDAETANRPFDINRNGFLFSEGASVAIVLEELDTATSRGAPIIAEVIGYGESFEAYNIMRMGKDITQISRMLSNAVMDANISLEDIDYVNAHGTGTINNDEIESEVLSKFFGPSTLVNSTKSLVGHTIGASGGLEAVVCALSLKEQRTHICKNLSNPISDLNFVTEVLEQRLDTALSQSFAFGGHNSALILRRYAN